MTTFRERVELAIESRESLDTPDLQQSSLAASGDDRAWWQEQLRLEQAIAEWRNAQCSPRPLQRNVRRLAAVVSVAAAGLVAGWITTGMPIFPPDRAARTAVGTEETAAMSNGAAAASGTFADRPAALPDDPFQSDQFAEAAATAGRLAYAFEPVGERVGTVFRFLVDSVPGSDVFAM